MYCEDRYEKTAGRKSLKKSLAGKNLKLILPSGYVDMEL